MPYYSKSGGGAGLTPAQQAALASNTTKIDAIEADVIQSGAPLVGDTSKLELKDKDGNVEATIDMSPYLVGDGEALFAQDTVAAPLTPTGGKDGDAMFVLRDDNSERVWKRTAGAWAMAQTIVPVSVENLTEPQVTGSPTDPDYQLFGSLSRERLDQWGMSRRVRRVFDEAGAFDFNALGYADRTAVFVRNPDAVNGKPITYGTGGANTLFVTRADGTQQTVTGQDVFTNLQPGEFAVMEKDGTDVRLSILPGERVIYFDNYAQAAAQAASRVPFDGIVIIRNTGEIYTRKTLTNSVAFPADGQENAEWFKVGGGADAVTLTDGATAQVGLLNIGTNLVAPAVVTNGVYQTVDPDGQNYVAYFEQSGAWVAVDGNVPAINPDDVDAWDAAETDIAQGALRKFDTGTEVLIFGRIVDDATADGGTEPDPAKWQDITAVDPNTLTVIDSDAAGGTFLTVYGEPHRIEVTGSTALNLLFPADGGANENLYAEIYNKSTTTVTLNDDNATVIPAGGFAKVVADAGTDGPFVWSSGETEAGGSDLRVEIPVSDSSLVSDQWSVTDVGFDLTTETGRLVLESGLGELEIELPMVAGKTYHSGAIRANEAWQIRSQALAGSSSLRVATGYTAANGGTTTLTRIWHYKTQKEVVDPTLVEVEDADVVLIDVDATNNTFYPFSTGETWADIETNYENIRFDINVSRSGSTNIRSMSAVINPRTFQALASQSGYWITQALSGAAATVNSPSDTDTGFTYRQSNGDAPTSGRMQFRVTGLKKKRTVVRPEDATVQSGYRQLAGANTTRTTITFPQPFATPPDVTIALQWNYNISSNSSLTQRSLVLDGAPTATGFNVRGIGTNALDGVRWIAVERT